MGKEFERKSSNQDKETAGSPQDALIAFLYDYFRQKCSSVDLLLPTVKYGKHPTYTAWEHVMHVDTDDMSGNGVLAITEESIHSIVAQFQARKASSQAIHDHNAKLADMELGRDRQVEVIRGLREQVTHYNSEEFLARYALYHFLADPVVSKKIEELFSLTSADVFEILREAVILGLQLEANHNEGFSDAWYHTWGYLAASMLFVSKSKLVPESLFNMGSREVEAMAYSAINRTKILQWQLDEFAVKDGRSFANIQVVALSGKLTRFEIALRRHLNPDLPDNFEVVPGKYIFR